MPKQHQGRTAFLSPVLTESFLLAQPVGHYLYHSPLWSRPLILTGCWLLSLFYFLSLYAMCSLCDLGKVTCPLWAVVSSILNQLQSAEILRFFSSPIEMCLALLLSEQSYPVSGSVVSIVEA